MNLSPETVSTRLLFHPLNFRLLEGDSATTLKSSLRDTESSKLSLSLSLSLSSTNQITRSKKAEVEVQCNAVEVHSISAR